MAVIVLQKYFIQEVNSLIQKHWVKYILYGGNIEKRMMFISLQMEH